MSSYFNSDSDLNVQNYLRGLSRRNFLRTLGAAGAAAAALPMGAYGQSAQAPAPPAAADGATPRRRGMGQGGGDFGETRVRSANAVVISSNENPLGPSPLALQALAQTGALGGRYHRESQQETISAFSNLYGLKRGYVALYPGSSGPLDFAVYSNVGPDKPLIVGEPSYEQAAGAGAKMKAPVFRVPLTATGAHDVRAMVAANPNAGAFYICNPNNPTGTMTPKEDIVWLVKNKPKGSVVIVDEAYHHFSTDESSIDLVANDQDVIVLRTFSKVYGMAGLRAGFFIAKPDYQAKLRDLGPGVGTGSGMGSVAISTAAAATASITDKDLVPLRRKINADIRADVLAWMDKNSYEYMKGSQANFFQVNVKRPGPEFAHLMQKDEVYVGRTWTAMPNYIRVTVGTQAEMEKFKVSFKKAYETAPLAASAYLNRPFVQSPSELDRHLDV